MQKVDGEIKAGMSNPAKILLAYMRLSNCWDSKELAERFTVPLRTIQRWKMECAANVSDATGAIDGAPSEHGHNATRATDATDGAPLTPDMALAQDVHSCAGATKESPTEINTTLVVSTPLSPPTPAQPKRLLSQGSRLPGDWELPEDWRQWAKVNCFATDNQIDTEAANFADYWIAKPSQATSLDWKRTWQKWARKAFSQAGNRRPHNTGSYGHQQPKQEVENLSAMIARMRSEGALQ